MTIHRLFLALKLDEQLFAWEMGRRFRGMTISEGPNGYRVILRCYNRAREPQYAITEGDDPAQALENLLAALHTRGGDKLWRLDQFANGRRAIVGWPGK